MTRNAAPLDPRIAAVLPDITRMMMPDPQSLTIARCRELIEENRSPLTPQPLPEVRNLTIQGPQTRLAARLYKPTLDRPLPAIVFFHGGGFVCCNLETHDALCRSLAIATQCAVLSVDYRLAPETKFPGPLEDCFAATAWLARESAALGLASTPLVVAGDSAGANLATGVARMARDHGFPAIRHQVLFYPVTDCQFDTASYKERGQGYFLTTEHMRWYWGHYLARAQDAADPLASPLRATEFAGMPATTLITADFDPLRDEGEALAARLSASGVPVRCERFPGMIHGFVSMDLLVPEVVQRALDFTAAGIGVSA